MVPSSATASVPQLLHFPLNVDIGEKVLVLISGCGFGRGSDGVY